MIEDLVLAIEGVHKDEFAEKTGQTDILHALASNKIQHHIELGRAEQDRLRRYGVLPGIVRAAVEDESKPPAPRAEHDEVESMLREMAQ